MGFISEKSRRAPSSLIRKMFAMQAGMEDVVSFALGEPDFTAPRHVIEAAAASFQRGETHYTPNAGLPALREAVAESYQARGLDMGELILIPLVLAGYARYLKGVDDTGAAFEPSPDPLLAELQAIVAPLEVKEGTQDMSCLKALYSRKDVFGLDLYEAGLGGQIEGMAAELFAGPGAVRNTLHKYVSAR